MIEILPYTRVGDIHFGMTRDEVIRCLGQPSVETTNRLGQRDLRYDHCAALLSPKEERVAEIMLFPSEEVVLHGIPVFTDPEAFEELARADGKPCLVGDIVLMPNLGIAINDFRTVQELSEREVTAFARGQWDDLKEQWEPLLWE